MAGAPCSASWAGRPARRGFWRAARGTGQRSQPRAGSADRTPVPGALRTAAEVWAAWGGVSGPRVCAESSAGSPFPRLCSLLGRGLSGSRPGDGPVIEKARRGSRGAGAGAQAWAGAQGQGRQPRLGGARRAAAAPSRVWPRLAPTDAGFLVLKAPGALLRPPWGGASPTSAGVSGAPARGSADKPQVQPGACVGRCWGPRGSARLVLGLRGARGSAVLWLSAPPPPRPGPKPRPPSGPLPRFRLERPAPAAPTRHPRSGLPAGPAPRGPRLVSPGKLSLGF